MGKKGTEHQKMWIFKKFATCILQRLLKFIINIHRWRFKSRNNTSVILDVDSSEQVHSAVSISLPHFTFKILFMAFITNIRHQKHPRKNHNYTKNCKMAVSNYFLINSSPSSSDLSTTKSMLPIYHCQLWQNMGTNFILTANLSLRLLK